MSHTEFVKSCKLRAIRLLEEKLKKELRYPIQERKDLK